MNSGTIFSVLLILMLFHFVVSVKAAKVVKPKVLFPYHYGATNVSAIPELLKADGIDVRIRHYE